MKIDQEFKYFAYFKLPGIQKILQMILVHSKSEIK